jgi:hypothetical protein
MTAPIADNQLEFLEPQDFAKKRVNLQTLTLEDIPVVVDPYEAIRNAVVAAQAFGRDLIIDYSVKNVVRGYTELQVATVATDLDSIMTLLSSGALYTAKEAIQSFTPTSLITAEDKDEFIGKIKTYLGL